MPQRKNRRHTSFTSAAAQSDRRQHRDAAPLPRSARAAPLKTAALRIPGQRATHESPRARFLALVQDNDVLNVFQSVTDETLVTFGQGMAYEAIRGEYASASALARNVWQIPDDAIELVTSAALTAYYPHAAQIVLARPSEASIRVLTRALAEHGFRLSRHSPRTPRG